MIRKGWMRWHMVGVNKIPIVGISLLLLFGSTTFCLIVLSLFPLFSILL